MTREELERELMTYHWIKRYHGTHTDLWQSGHKFVSVSDRGVEMGEHTDITAPRLPWSMISIEDGKVIAHKEIEL